MSSDSHRFRLTSVDYEPKDLYPQLPREGTFLRKIAGSDRPDYWLTELDAPLAWNDKGNGHTIKYLVLAARYVGQSISPPIQRIVVAISYVLDESLLADADLDFHKTRYVAIGEIVGT